MWGSHGPSKLTLLLCAAPRSEHDAEVGAELGRIVLSNPTGF